MNNARILTEPKDQFFEVVIDENGYINGTLLKEKTGKFLHQFLKDEETLLLIHHLQPLVENTKLFYFQYSNYKNVQGVYIHPHLALEYMSVLKFQDSDFTEEFEFLRKVIFEWIKSNSNKEEFNTVYEFYHETGDFYESVR